MLLTRYPNFAITVMVFPLILTTSAALEIPFPDDAHPFLYYSVKEVTELRAKAETTHAKITKHIKDAATELTNHPDWYLPPREYKVFAKDWNERYGNNLCSLSMYAVLYPDDKKFFGLVMEFMDRMASYPDWYVTDSHGKDQVPIGHSLTGFATAYDFLYDRLNRERREKYYHVIKNTTLHLHQLLTKGRFGWTREYVHNHAPSNIVALLLGALVVSAHEPDLPSPWIKQGKEHLDFAMELFSYVSDGSVDEGVSYGTYTSRGLTQYVFLAARHFNTDHTSNPWLEQHFWFLYKTLLPGYQRASGIADANHNWFYGPESHLVFLDSYVMKNGYGNWLADRIREARTTEKPLRASTSQIWSTRHTEFIFYNSSIAPRKPEEYADKKLYLFPDWGVATYGGGLDMQPGNSFFSFKSGALNGDAMQEVLFTNKYPKMITGWRNFNPGHEHPDQNSFVFAPNGRYFITESLYGPKFTWLNNAIVFSPSQTSNCNQPWEGQIGECDKWLHFQQYTKETRGEIVTASSNNDMMFAAAEAAQVYSKSLQLLSVYRAVLLLNPEVLIVVDTIRLRPGSKTRKASALFHNVWKEFEAYSNLGYPGAQVHYPEGAYTVFSLATGPHGKLDVKLHNKVQPAGLREGPTNYVNVTFDLPHDVTTIVHVFSGPKYQIKSVELHPVSEMSGISLQLNINGQDYKVNIATFARSISRIYDPIKERRRITGFNGFAQVRVGTKTHFFGLNEESLDPGKKNTFLSTVQLEEVRMQLGQSTEQRENPFATRERSAGVAPVRQEWLSSHLIQANSFLSLITVCVMILFATRGSKGNHPWTKRIREDKSIFAAFLLICLTVENTICIDSQGKNICFGRRKPLTKKDSSESSTMITPAADDETSKAPIIPPSPFVLMTSLPGSGGDLLKNAFEESNSVLYLSSNDLQNSGYKDPPNFCRWEVDKSDTHLEIMGWFNSLKTKPVLHFNQYQKDTTSVIKRRLRESYNAPFVLNDLSGFWLTKVPWIRSIVDRENLQTVTIVRDPRSWVHMLYKNASDPRKAEGLKQLLHSFDVVQEVCSKDGVTLPHYFHAIKALRDRRSKPVDPVEKLAAIWVIAIGSALADEAFEQGQWPMQIVKYEDVIKDPVQSVTNIFNNLGLPVGMKSLSKIKRVVKSGRCSIPFDGAMNTDTSTAWRKELQEADIRKIEVICCDLMKVIGYNCKNVW